MDRLDQVFTPARRYRIYVLLSALVPLLVLYGWLDQTAAAVWVGVVSAVFGTGMAAVNTPSRRMSETGGRVDRGEWAPQ